MIVIADDIMIVASSRTQRDHDVVLTTMLDTARTCNVRLNFEKLKYKKTEVEFFWETYTIDGCKPAKTKYLLLQECPLLPVKSKYNHLLEW